ncbi:MAG: hydrogenase maturation protease [Burkholderiaceae bacterium]
MAEAGDLGVAPRPLVIGIGEPMRGDDAFGRRVAQALAAMNDARVDVVECRGAADALLELFEGRDRVVIVDACRSGEMPGTMTRFDATTGPLPAVLDAASTHGFGLAAGIELARSLGRLPRACIVLAVVGEDFGVGRRLSPRSPRESTNWRLGCWPSPWLPGPKPA